MAGEDLSVSTPTETCLPSSTGPVGIGLSGLNAPVAALNASPSPTESGPAAEPRLSPKWTFTQLGSALEPGSHPEHTESSPTAAAGDPSGYNDYDPGYTDNDALCATCRFLLEDPDPNLELEGWEVDFIKRDPETGDDYVADIGYDWVFQCHLSTEMTWSSNLKSNLFDDKCPLCCELLCDISTGTYLDGFFQLHPTGGKITVLKSLACGQHRQCLSVGLVVPDKSSEHGYSFEQLKASIHLYPERENELHDKYSQCNEGYETQLFSKRTIGNPGPYESNTGSDLSWQLVSSWMAKCLSSHQKCNEVQSVVPPLPTRVIDVGSRGGGRPPCLHVVTENTSGRYATLSHRWGSEEMLKLEVNNLDDLKREIPLERLPKTFQDAIEATRRLGIRYIWIDSLCIIQDSRKDWAAESAKMTSVYENSYINFAAADAMDSTQGCFFYRNPSSIRPVRLHIDWSSAVDSVDPVYCYAARSHSFGDNVAKVPLYRRGWVYQERTLARRIIHCCSKQLYWECLESIASESFPTGQPHCIECFEIGSCLCGKWRKMAPQASNINRSLDGSSTTSAEYFASLLIWNRVVSQYTTLDLTFDRDKLVAISGLAKMHSRFLNTRYLAGMWLEHLPVQLLWYRDWFKDRVARAYNEYIAPSWSWASIAHPVALQVTRKDDLQEIRTKYRPIIQILDATVNLADENHPFGAVSGGSLSIKGPLANSSLINSLAFDESLEGESVCFITYNGIRVGLYGMDTVYWPSLLRRKKPIYLLLVMLDMSYCWGCQNDTGTYVSGLILQETDRGENIFQRVGVFDLYSSSIKIIDGTEEEDETEKEDGIQMEKEDGIQMLQEACRSQNGPDNDGPFPEWGKFQTITLI